MIVDTIAHEVLSSSPRVRFLLKTDRPQIGTAEVELINSSSPYVFCVTQALCEWHTGVSSSITSIKPRCTANKGTEFCSRSFSPEKDPYSQHTVDGALMRCACGFCWLLYQHQHFSVLRENRIKDLLKWRTYALSQTQVRQFSLPLSGTS